MAFQPKDIITITDYNSFVALINEIYGLGDGDKGYGGNSLNVLSNSVDLPTVNPKDKIQNESWLDLTNAYNDCALHQGTTLPFDLPLLVNLEDGDSIGFSTSSSPNFSSFNELPPNNYTTLTDNRMLVNSSNLSTMTTRLTSIRSTPWGIDHATMGISHEFVITFNDSDHARHFFNTGSEIKLSASRTGGTIKPQNITWSELLQNTGTLTIDRDMYYSLTSSFVDVLLVSPPNTTTYGDSSLPDFSSHPTEPSKNTWTISIRRDDSAGVRNGNGSIIRVKSTFRDGFIGPSQPSLDGITPVGGLPDFVDGVFTHSVNELKSSVIFDVVPPIYTTVTELSVGS